MAKSLNSAVGVDIGCQSIKVAEIKLLGGQPTVTALAQTMTPEGTVDHVGIHDGEAVGSVLKQLIAGAGTTTNDLIVSVAGQGSVLVRTLEVPNMSDSELDQHMEWEITRNIPFGEKTVQSDYKAFPPSDAASQNMDVVMAISPQSAVETIAGMVRKAGKKCAAIDVEPLGIARALKVGYDAELHGKTVCVVDIGHKTTSINIYKDSQLLMPRIVPIGGEMFTRAIADAMGTGTEEAERIKIEKCEIPAGASTAVAAPAQTQTFEPYNPFGDSSEEETPAAPVVAEEPAVANSPMFNAIAEVLDQLTAEVRRSIDYFRSKGGDVETILLAGGGSKLKGLSRFLEGAVGVRTHAYEPMRGLGQNIKVQSDSVDQTNMEEFAVAIGNGLHVCF